MINGYAKGEIVTQCQIIGFNDLVEITIYDFKGRNWNVIEVQLVNQSQTETCNKSQVHLWFCRPMNNDLHIEHSGPHNFQSNT